MQLIMLGCSHLLARPPATTTTATTGSHSSHHLNIITASLNTTLSTTLSLLSLLTDRNNKLTNYGGVAKRSSHQNGQLGLPSVPPPSPPPLPHSIPPFLEMKFLSILGRKVGHNNYRVAPPTLSQHCIIPTGSAPLSVHYNNKTRHVNDSIKYLSRSS